MMYLAGGFEGEESPLQIFFSVHAEREREREH